MNRLADKKIPAGSIESPGSPSMRTTRISTKRPSPAEIRDGTSIKPKRSPHGHITLPGSISQRRVPNEAPTDVLTEWDRRGRKL